MLDRNHPLGKVVHTGEVKQAIGHGERAAPEVSFEYSPCDRAEPRMIELANLLLSRRKIAATKRPALSHLLEHPRDIVRLAFQELFKAVRAHPVRVHSMAQSGQVSTGTIDASCAQCSVNSRRR